MPRNITVTFRDGSKHIYSGVPDSVTPSIVMARATKEFSKPIQNIDGGKAAVPVQTRQQGVQAAARSAIAAKAPAASGGGFLDGLENTVGAAYRGIQDNIPFVNHLQAAANEVGSAVGLNDNKMSYRQRVNAFQQQRDAAMDQDKSNGILPAAAHYAGEVAGALGGGGLEARGALAAGRGIAKVVPAAGRVAAAVGAAVPRTSTVAKLAAGGAAGAGIAAADDPNASAGSVGTAAGVGAVAGPVAAAGLRLASVISRPIADAAGLSTAANIAQRYIKTSAQDLADRADAFRARTNTNPTLFELLPLEDRQGVQKFLGLSPSTTKTQAAKSISDRAANMGPELAQQAHAAIAPQADAITGQMAQDLANARGQAHVPGAQPVAPTPDDIAMAQRAAASPTDLSALRDQEARLRMAPHDDRIIADNVNDLVPHAPQQQPDGTVADVETANDVGSLIRRAAGVQRIDPTGVTVRDITDMISGLKGDVGRGGIEGRTAQQAIDHLTDELSARDPNAAAAHDAMTDAYAARSRMMEGYKAGTQGQLRDDINVGTNRGTAQDVRNAFDTPEGQAGRTLGQAASLRQQFSQAPGASVRAAADVATNPSTQAAINANVGGDAGTSIADSANAQTESARNLSGLNPEQPGQGHRMDLPSMAHALIAMNPASMLATKAAAGARIARAFIGLPEKQTSAIVDGLFSQNPTQIATAMKFLRSSGSQGEEALQALGGSLAGGATAGGLVTSPEQPIADPGAPPLPADPTADPSAQAAPDASAAPAGADGQPMDPNGITPVDPAQSPYASQLQHIYDTESPEFLNLVEGIQHQESRGRQFDKNGEPLTSKAGAVGLMQLEPAAAQDAAKSAGVAYDPGALSHDAAYNKLLGVHYIAGLLHKYGGDVQKATAAYNAGSGAVDNATDRQGNLDVSALPQETQAYIPAVTSGVS